MVYVVKTGGCTFKKSGEMRGSREWCEMVEAELKELARIADRKADKSQVSQYLLEYGAQKSTPSSPLKNTPPQLGYRFGQDLNADFTTLFSAFNRVAKQKLDKSNLSHFASTAFLDSLYQQRSVEFSAELTGSCALYYRLFDERIEQLCQKMQTFRQTVFARLEEINARTRQLSVLVRKLLTSPNGRLTARSQMSSRAPTTRDFSSTMGRPVETRLFSFTRDQFAQTQPVRSRK